MPYSVHLFNLRPQYFHVELTTETIISIYLISVIGVDGRELSFTLLDGRDPSWGHSVQQQHHGGLQQLPATRGGKKSPQLGGQSPQ
jgi:hypothetical protein